MCFRHLGTTELFCRALNGGCFKALKCLLYGLQFHVYIMCFISLLLYSCFIQFIVSYLGVAG